MKVGISHVWTTVISQPLSRAMSMASASACSEVSEKSVATRMCLNLAMANIVHRLGIGSEGSAGDGPVRSTRWRAVGSPGPACTHASRTSQLESPLEVAELLDD